MKKLFIIILVIFTASLVYAGNKAGEDSWVQPGDVATTDDLVHNGDCLFHGLIVSTDGTNSVTVDVYDSTTATGTKIIPSWVVTSAGNDRVQALSLWPPVRCFTGIYIDVTTAGTVEFVPYFKKR